MKGFQGSLVTRDTPASLPRNYHKVFATRVRKIARGYFFERRRHYKLSTSIQQLKILSIIAWRNILLSFPFFKKQLSCFPSKTIPHDFYFEDTYFVHFPASSFLRPEVTTDKGSHDHRQRTSSTKIDGFASKHSKKTSPQKHDHSQGYYKRLQYEKSLSTSSQRFLESIQYNDHVID